METGTGLTVLGGAIGGAKLLEKLLGPTADYLGEDIIRPFAARCVQNLQRIFAVAQRRLGDKLDEAGGVAPRVLRIILDSGSFCDDAIGAEYFGGLLASSRSASLDDRAIPYLRLVEESSLYDIRVHYLLYSSIRRHFVGIYSLDHRPVSLADRPHKLQIYLPKSAVAAFLDLSGDQVDTALSDSLMFLGNRGLINPATVMRQRGYEDVPEDGPVLHPSVLGARLFLWVHGFPDSPIDDLVRSSADIMAIPGVTIPDSILALRLRSATSVERQASTAPVSET